MAKVTWLGEDNLHKTVTSEGVTVESAGPSFTTAFGLKFPKGEAVEVADTSIIERAKKNQFFKVQDETRRGPGRPPKNPQELKDGEQDSE